MLTLRGYIVPVPVVSTDPTTSRQDDDGESDMSKLWCYCNEPTFGDMVMWKNAQSNGFILTASESDVHQKGSGIVLHAVNIPSFVS